ncbi:hypothetical protein OSB04_029825 [Centaurea solstitialis]|uniref:Uncharacterized protein n=1 Tax=Centaurea solstitialis TaxID=347529 RepID=A0AA38VW50_9ASTR|nr:hypothetical protein OSB04_029825 [Centaurea solstitialis]
MEEEKKKKMKEFQRGTQQMIIIIYVFVASAMIKFQSNLKFPFKTHPRTMNACLTEIMIYALAISVEDMISLWRCHTNSLAPTPWYVGVVKRISLVMLLLTVPFLFVF